MVQTTKHGKSGGTEDGGNDRIEMNQSSRKSNKPMMERKRRARINDSLNELKSLVLHASGKEETNFSKLDKADILELTVQHIATLQQNGSLGAHVTSMEGSANFMGGFSACAKESLGLLSTLTDVTGIPAPANLQAGLFNHLTNTQCRLSPEIKSSPQIPAYVHVQAPPQQMAVMYDPNLSNLRNPALLHNDPRTSSNPIKGEQLIDPTIPSLQRVPPTSNIGNMRPVVYPIHVTVPCSSFSQVASNGTHVQPNMGNILMQPSVSLSSATVKHEPLDARDYVMGRDLSDSASEGSQSPTGDDSPDSKSAWRPW